LQAGVHSSTDVEERMPTRPDLVAAVVVAVGVWAVVMRCHESD